MARTIRATGRRGQTVHRAIYGFTAVYRSPVKLAHSAEERRRPSPCRRILLAEDDDSLRGFLARALERAGYEVIACADGEEAVAVLDQTLDLLLTDIVMPGHRRHRGGAASPPRASPGLRIMFITGFAAVAL